MQPTVLDLFAGCGGFSVGLRDAGLNTVGAVEFDEWAADSLRANFPSAMVMDADIRSLSRRSATQFDGVDVIVGGPPCQGFSVAGPTQFGVRDPRNDLPHVFLDWVEWLFPKVAIIENVPGILRRGAVSEGTSVEDLVRCRLQPLGFTVSARILMAADYGVPQLRRRAFIVASRTKTAFVPPAATHSEPRVGGDLFRAKDYVTVGEALGDLPQIAAGEGVEHLVPYASDTQNPYQKEMRVGSAGVANHIAMRHTERLIQRFKTIQQGKSLKDVAPEFGQLRKGTGEVTDQPFKYNNYRLSSNAPSLSIPASFQSLFLHPVLHRNITAREAARLMSFPDTFVFMGKRTTMSWEKHLSQYNQIGNAVCPLVATAVGLNVLKALSSGVPRRRHSRQSVVLPSVASPIHPGRDVREWSCPSPLDNEVVSLLVDVGRSMTRIEDAKVAAAAALAVLVTTETDCFVCRPDLEPKGHHLGSIPVLITKEETDSLVSTENDHGLDFHLRCLLSTDFKVTQEAAEGLAKRGLAVLGVSRNVRTGRNVRTLTVDVVTAACEALRPIVYKAIQKQRGALGPDVVGVDRARVVA